MLIVFVTVAGPFVIVVEGPDFVTVTCFVVVCAVTVCAPGIAFTDLTVFTVATVVGLDPCVPAFFVTVLVIVLELGIGDLGGATTSDFCNLIGDVGIIIGDTGFLVFTMRGVVLILLLIWCRGDLENSLVVIVSVGIVRFLGLFPVLLPLSTFGSLLELPSTFVSLLALPAPPIAGDTAPSRILVMLGSRERLLAEAEARSALLFSFSFSSLFAFLGP
jgi:hypothetical protein